MPNKQPRKGSTEWYRIMAGKIKHVTAELKNERNKRFWDRWKKRNPFTGAPVIIPFKPWPVDDFQSKGRHNRQADIYRYLMGCDPAMDPPTMSFHMIDQNDFPKEGDPKFFENLPSSVTRRRLLTREEILKQYPYTPEELDKMLALKKQQESIPLGEGLFSQMVGASEENGRRNIRDMLKDFIPNEPAQKMFAGKVYYLWKQQAIVQCMKDIDNTHLILRGMCIYLNDAKSNCERQKITVRAFQDHSPVEIDEKFLHKYPFLEEYNQGELMGQVSKVWRTKAKECPSYLPEAEIMADEYNGRYPGRGILNAPIDYPF